MAMLWELLREQKITHHGIFLNLQTGRTVPLAVDPKAWMRFGYGAKKEHFRARKEVKVKREKSPELASA